MATGQKDERDLSIAVQQLQREVRLWKRSVSLLLLIVILIACAGSKLSQDVPGIVTAREGFVLKDNEGRVRAVLGFDQVDGRVGLTLLDEDGHARTELGLSKKMDRYGVYVRDEKDRNRIFMGFFEDQYTFELYDQKKTNRLAIAQLDKSGDSGLAVRDESGVARLGLGQFVNRADGLNWVGLTIHDRNQQERLQLFCDMEDKLSGIRVMDRTGQFPRIGMGVTYGDETAHFSVWGSERQERVGIEVDQKNKMRIELKDKDNRSINLMRR